MKSVLKISLSIVTSFVLLTGLTSWVGGSQTTDWYYNGTVSENFFQASNWDQTNDGGACAEDVPRPCHLAIGASQTLQQVLNSYSGNTTELLIDAGQRAE